MEINPFLKREIRTRWRGKRAYWSLLCSASMAAILVGLMYWQASSMVNGHQSRRSANFAATAIWLASGPQRVRYSSDIASVALAQFGHSLFLAFAWFGTVGWLFQACSLTSAAIAGEREHGSLEALQLSPLGPSGILAGKLAANLLYAAMIYLAALPLGAICLLLTGVSPGDFCLVVLTHGTSAIFGALVGLAVSSTSHRATHALRSANRRMTLWFISTMVVAAFSGPPRLVLPAMGAGFTPRLALNSLLQLYSLTNPIYAVVLKLDSPPGGRFAEAYFCLSFQLVFGGALFAFAARNLKGSLAQAEWVRWRQVAKPQGSGNLFSLPGTMGLNFGNPILAREFRSKFRMRYPPLAVILFEALLALVVACAYFYMAFLTWTQPATREYAWGVLAILAFLLGAGSCAVMGATGVTRERENGTWEGLQLALLSPAEVLRGKWQAALFSCLALSPPLWPLLLLSVKSGSPLAGNTQGVHPVQLVSLILVLSSSAFMACALGLCISTYRKASSAAANATMLGLTVFWGLLPIARSLIGNNRGPNTAWRGWLPCINPFEVLLPGDHSVGSLLTGGGPAFALWSVLWGAVLLRTAARRIDWEWRLVGAGTSASREP